MKKKNDFFIKIYNSFITNESTKKLTVNELYIYCYLYTLRTFENKVITNYEMLCVENRLYKNQTDNKKEIKNCIDSLREKQVIHIQEQKKLLIISFSFEEKGHVQITYEKFRLFTDPRDLYIYVAVSKWEQKGGAKYSNNELANLLDITREYAISVIEDACEREIIYKKTGAYTENIIGSRNQKVQEKNTYSIKPFSNDKFKIEEEKSTIDLGIVKEASIVQTENLKFHDEVHNWNNNNNLDVKDFVFYLNNMHDKEIKEMCEKKINRIISKNEKFNFVMDKLMKEAEEIIASNTRKEKENQDKEISTIIKQTNDVVLQIKNELIPYKEYGGQGNGIEKIYYFEKVDISNEVGKSGAFRNDLRCKVNPKAIDIYRKKDGDWRERIHIYEDEITIEEEYSKGMC